MQSVKADACLQPAKEGDQPLPGYRLVRRRGRGGFGEVWEAEAPGGFLVALKYVHLSNRCRSAELWALEVVRGIRHPNLVVSFGSWQVEDVLIVGMELADRSLADRLLEAIAQGLRGIPREELLGYMADVASAIDFLNSDRHELEGRNGVGLQHRDLKPQNILLFGDGAKVADFGQSRILERGTSGSAGPCSLPYTAPECFGGNASRHSDQYSLAVTYCQLRGGHLPFVGDGDRIKAGHLTGIPNLGGLPEAERPMVARALAKRPEERWPDCQAFMTALRIQGGTATCPVPNVLTGAKSVGDWAFRSQLAAESFAVTATPADSESAWELAEASLDRLAPDDVTRDHPTGPFEGSAPGGVHVVNRPGSAEAAPVIAAFPTRAVGAPDVLTGRARITRAASFLLASSLALTSSELRPSLGRVEHPAFANQMAKAVIPPPILPMEEVEELILEPVEEPMREHAPASNTPPVESPVAMAASSVPPPSAAGDFLAIRIPPELHRTRPELDLPAEVNIRQGVAQRMKIQVRRGADMGPVGVRFTNLPPGVTIECREIPAGAASTEGIVSASADAVAVVTEVGVVASLGAERAESRVRLCILASPAIPYQRGRDHLARGAYDHASAEFTEAIRLDPKHAWAFCYRAVATYLGGNHRRALDDYTEAIRLMPNSALVYGARGRIQYDLGAHDKALADYSEAIRLQPENAIAYSARGRIYDDLGKYDKALADCSEAIRLMPDDIAARYRRGLVRYHASDYASAIDDFTEVIRLDSKYAWAYRSRGDAYARLGDGTRAGADRDLALRLAASQSDPVAVRETVPLPNPPTAMPRERPTLKASPAARETPGPAGSIPLTRSRL